MERGSQKSGNRSALNAAISASLLLVLTLLFFWPATLQGKVVCLRDLNGIFYPWRRFLADSVLHGQFPLWNPYSFFGQPFIANPQTAAFYPLTYMFLLSSSGQVVNWYIILHVFIAGFTMYLLARELRLSVGSSLLASVGYAFGGWMVRSIEFLSLLSSAAWTPLILLLFLRGLRERLFSNSLLLAVAMALQTFAGYPLIQALTLYMLAIISLVRMIAGLWKREALQVLGRLAILVGVGGIAWLGLVLVQLLPVMELVKESGRAGGGTELVGQMFYSLHPVELLNFLTPYFFGYPDWQKSFYVGLIPLFLLPAALAALREPRAPKVVLASGVLIVLLSVAMSLGTHTPLFALVGNSVPLLSGMMNWPSLWMFPAVIALCLGAGFGMEWLFAGPKDVSWSRPRYGVFLVATAALLAAWAVIEGTGTFHLASLIRQRFWTDVLTVRNPAILPHNFDAASQVLRLATAAVAGAGVLLICLRKRVSRPMAATIITAATFADCFLHGSGQSFFAPADIYRSRPALLERLSNEAGAHRVDQHPKVHFLNDALYGSRDISEFLAVRDAFMEESSLPYGVRKTYGWKSVVSERAKKFLTAVYAGPPDPQIRAKLLSLAGVSYTVVAAGGRLGSVKNLTINTLAPPQSRAFAAKTALRVRSVEEAMGKLRSADFDPRTHVLIEGPGPESAPASDEFAASVTERSRSLQRVSLECEFSEPGYLVITDSWYPGWKAYVNGEERPIARANIAFMGLRLGAGKYDVELRYEPWWWPLAPLMSAASWVLVLGGASALRIMRKR